LELYITGFAFRDELRCAQDESCTELKYFSKKRKIFTSADHGAQGPAKAPQSPQLHHKITTQ
jgi:hypothetical protein